MYCYVYDHYKENNLTTDQLLMKSLELYLKESKFEGDFLKDAEGKPKAKVERTEYGKPYFVATSDGVTQELPHCSVTHTDNLWICAISDIPVGIDVEYIRDRCFDQISARCFTPGEQEYVLGCMCDKGEDGLCSLCGEGRCLVNLQSYRVRERFFEVWTRKESYGKLLGKGLRGGMLALDTKKDGCYQRVELPPEIPGVDPAPGRGITCMCCTREERPVKHTRVLEIVL